MGRRTNRRQRTRESGSAQRRRSTSKITWAAGAAVAILILAAGGIFYSNSQGPDKDLLSSPATQEVGIDLGDQFLLNPPCWIIYFWGALTKNVGPKIDLFRDAKKLQNPLNSLGFQPFGLPKRGSIPGPFLDPPFPEMN